MVKDEDLREGPERKDGCSGEKGRSMLSAVRKAGKLAIPGPNHMIQRKPEKKCLRGAGGRSAWEGRSKACDENDPKKKIGALLEG